MYSHTGKQIIFNDGNGNVHIADAGDNEKAHFLTEAANRLSFDFVELAHVTCSPEFHGDKVSKHEFVSAINEAIRALNKLDRVKKSLFYGRDNNLDPRPGQADTFDLPARIIQSSAEGDVILSNEEAINYIHGVIGVATEAGEMLEAMRDHINGQNPFDRVNLMEETGDAKWYMALLAKIGRFAWGDDERAIIKKLKLRFGEKFSAYFANNRNLEAERLLLETANPDPSKAEPKAAAAFEASRRVGEAIAYPDAVSANVGNPELSKPAHERKTNMPNEPIAHQLIRGEDA